MKKLIIFCLTVGFAACKPSSNSNTQTPDHTHQNKAVYTCSMHPEVKLDKPGACPKCGMDLVKK